MPDLRCPAEALGGAPSAARRGEALPRRGGARRGEAMQGAGSKFQSGARGAWPWSQPSSALQNLLLTSSLGMPAKWQVLTAGVPKLIATG